MLPVAVLLVLICVCQSSADRVTCDSLMREQVAAKEKFVVNHFMQAMLQLFCNKSDDLGMVSNGSIAQEANTKETPFCSNNYYCADDSTTKEDIPTNVDVKEEFYGDEEVNSRKIPWRDARTPQTVRKRQSKLKFGNTTNRANTSCLCPRDMIAVPVIVIECKHPEVVEEDDG